ncbi:MAG: DUF2721 domain-containing protein [Methylacidiphilales bacterium]|nr:DUF2721 domain-containing protein [Candidatus Methylacidiphilales bacterium]
MLLNDIVPVIQLSVSPVILISGVGLVLLSMINRFGRAIDTSRTLLDKAADVDPAEKAHVLSQIYIIYGRCRSLRVAITFASLSLLQIALFIGLLFLFRLFHLEMAVLLVILFIGSMATLSASLVFFLLDINGSLRALAIEVKKHGMKS